MFESEYKKGDKYINDANELSKKLFIELDKKYILLERILLKKRKEIENDISKYLKNYQENGLNYQTKLIHTFPNQNC